MTKELVPVKGVFLSAVFGMCRSQRSVWKGEAGGQPTCPAATPVKAFGR